MIVNAGAAPRHARWANSEKALLITLFATGVAAILPWTAPAWWFADLCSHFALQWMMLGLFAALVFGIRRRWVCAGASCAVIAVAFLTINSSAAPAPLFESAPPGSGRAQALRIVFSNIYYRNPHADRVIDFARASHADILVLAEVTQQWKTALAPLSSQFPYQHYAYLPGQRRTGLLLLSRWPLKSSTTLEFGRTGDPGVVATIDTRAGVLHLIGVHPTWPLWRSSTLNRNAQFRRIAALAQSQGTATVVVGDFNATAFSPAFQSFVRQSGLASAARGRGWMPTWPTFFPPAYIQIDQALVSRDVQIVNFTRGSRVGSDHLPIVLDLAALTPSGMRGPAATREAR